MNRKTLLISSVLSLVLSLSLVFSGGIFAQSPANSQLRVIHAVGTAPPVDIYMNGVLMFSGVIFGEATPHVSLPEGEQTVELRLAEADPSTAPLFSQSVNLLSGLPFTLVVQGSPDAIQAALYEDSIEPIAGGGSRLVAIHAIPNAAPVDILRADGGPLMDNVSFGQPYGSINLPPGAYDLVAIPDGGDLSAPLASFGVVNMQMNVFYTLLIAPDENGDPIGITFATPFQGEDQTAPVQFVHGITDSIAVDVYLDETLVLTGLQPESVSQLAPYGIGEHSVTLRESGTPANSEAIFEGEFTITDGLNTVSFVLENDAIAVANFETSLASLSAESAQLQAFNFGAEPVDVSLSSGDTLADALTAPNAGEAVVLLADTYDLIIGDIEAPEAIIGGLHYSLLFFDNNFLVTGLNAGVSLNSSPFDVEALAASDAETEASASVDTAAVPTIPPTNTPVSGELAAPPPADTSADTSDELAPAPADTSDELAPAPADTSDELAPAPASEEVAVQPTVSADEAAGNFADPNAVPSGGSNAAVTGEELAAAPAQDDAAPTAQPQQQPVSPPSAQPNAVPTRPFIFPPVEVVFGVISLNQGANLHCREYPSPNARSVGLMPNNTELVIQGLFAPRDETGEIGRLDAIPIPDVPDFSPLLDEDTGVDDLPAGLLEQFDIDDFWLEVDWQLEDGTVFTCWSNAEYIEIQYDGERVDDVRQYLEMVSNRNIDLTPYNVPSGPRDPDTVVNPSQVSAPTPLPEDDRLLATVNVNRGVNLQLRRTPGTDGESLALLPGGSQMEVIGKTIVSSGGVGSPSIPEWLYVEIEQVIEGNADLVTIRGWISAEYVELFNDGRIATVEDVDELVETPPGGYVIEDEIVPDDFIEGAGQSSVPAGNTAAQPSGNTAAQPSGNAVAPAQPAPMTAPAFIEGRLLIAPGTTINLRDQPSTESLARASLASDMILQVVGRNGAGDWLNVVADTESGDVPGWVSAEFVTVTFEGAPFSIAELPVSNGETDTFTGAG